MPAGVTIGAVLTSTATVGGSTSEFSNNVAVFASPPDITLTKECIAPANCTTESQTPGSELTYRITFVNVGGSPAFNFMLIDPADGSGIKLNDHADFKLGSVLNGLGMTGLGVAVSYSNDNAVTFAYTPTDGGGGAPPGYDRNVTHIRWAFTGTLGQNAPDNTGSATFIVRIR